MYRIHLYKRAKTFVLQKSGHTYVRVASWCEELKHTTLLTAAECPHTSHSFTACSSAFFAKSGHISQLADSNSEKLHFSLECTRLSLVQWPQTCFSCYTQKIQIEGKNCPLTYLILKVHIHQHSKISQYASVAASVMSVEGVKCDWSAWTVTPRVTVGLSSVRWHHLWEGGGSVDENKKVTVGVIHCLCGVLSWTFLGWVVAT